MSKKEKMEWLPIEERQRLNGLVKKRFGKYANFCRATNIDPSEYRAYVVGRSNYKKVQEGMLNHESIEPAEESIVYFDAYRELKFKHGSLRNFAEKYKINYTQVSLLLNRGFDLSKDKKITKTVLEDLRMDELS